MADPRPADPSRLRPVSPVTLPDRDRLGAPLPAPLTRLVGREREVRAIVGMVRDPDARLVTLTGPGGVGKTRLALRVAELARDIPHDVAFVPLAAVRDPSLVLPTVATALNVRESGNRPLVDRLAAFLRDRALLLVLDNLEQVVSVAPRVAVLLAACPGLTVLATSRAPMRVTGERIFVVSPMALPTWKEGTGGLPPLEELERTEAVRLFAERAQAARAGFTLTEANAGAVAEICARLDGLPLAIELAAARVGTLPPVALLGRLQQRLPLLTAGPRDQPQRLRTMRDAIGWSYDLLDEDEQPFFRQLAVFVGGFTLEAAEAVGASEKAGSDLLPRAWVLDLVTSLVEQSLLRTEEAAGGEARYAMLETVREFGLERLTESAEEPAVRGRHAAWCLALAEAVGPRVRTWERVASTVRLDAEHDNLRSALAWFLEAGLVDEALRLADALRIFWYVRGHAGEGLRWLERALAADPAGASSVRARALLAAAHLAHHLGDDDRATGHLVACLECYRVLDDRPGQAFPLHMLGMIAEDQADYDRAATLLEEARALFVVAGNGTYAANAVYHLGIAAYGLGALDTAIERYGVAIEEAGAAGDAYTAAAALGYLGLARCDRGEVPQAVEAVSESLTMHRSAKDLIGLARGVAHLAVIAQAGHEPNAAARLFGAFDALTEWVGYGFAHPEVDRYERSRAALRAEMGEAAYAAATDDGRSLGLDAALAEAESIGEVITTRARSDQQISSRTPSSHGLTPREVEVLRLLAQRRTDREIADALFISPKTAGFHVANILGKLGVANRREAAAFAAGEGLASAAS